MAAAMAKISSMRCPNRFAACALSREPHLLSSHEKPALNIERCKSTTTEVSSAQYCMDYVKKHDHENYVCTLTYPREYRTSAFAIRALYVEMALVQTVASDKDRAVMRLQFWKDTIDKIYKGSPPNTPVAKEVARAVEKHDLSKAWFTRILNARVNMLNNDFFVKISDVDEKGENTSSALNYLLLQAAGVQNVTADHAASHIGKCYNVVNLLRSTIYHSKQNRMYLPYDLLIKYRVPEEQLIQCQDKASTRALIHELASHAHTHLQTARFLKKNVPKEANLVLMNSVICDRYLKRLQGVDFDVFHSKLQGRDSKVPWLLFKHKNFLRRY